MSLTVGAIGYVVTASTTEYGRFVIKPSRVASIGPTLVCLCDGAGDPVRVLPREEVFAYMSQAFRKVVVLSRLSRAAASEVSRDIRDSAPLLLVEGAEDPQRGDTVSALLDWADAIKASAEAEGDLRRRFDDEASALNRVRASCPPGEP